MYPNLDPFSKVINDSVAELEKNETERAKQIESMIVIVKKILRFIDRKICVNIHFQIDDDDMKFIPQYYPENGILVYVNNADRLEHSSSLIKINDIFPQEQRESRFLRGTRGGDEIYLTRNGTLISFTRSGSIWDAWSADQEDNYYSLSIPVELSPLDLVQKYGNFNKEFMFHFKLAIVNAIKRNDNKRAILKKVVEYISQSEKKNKQEKDYEKEIALNPDNPQAYIDYACFLMRKKDDFPRGEKLFQQALVLAPQSAEARLKYAEFLRFRFQREKWLHKEGYEQYRKDAEIQYLKALELAPDSSEAHTSYANYFWMFMEKEKLKQLAKDAIQTAEAEYRKALELNPKNVEALTDYAFFLYWVKGEYDPIPALFEKTIEFEPLHVGNYLNYAGVLSMIGKDLNAAEKLYLKALEIDPESVDAHLTYTDFLMWTKRDVAAAEPYLRKLTEIKPEEVWSHTKYGDFLLIVKQRPSAAEIEYRNALEVSASKSDPRMRSLLLLRLASTAFIADRKEEARKSLAEIRITTNDTDILLAHDFYAYLYEPKDIRRKEILVEIKHLLEQGVRVNQWAGFDIILWNITQHIKQATKAGYPTPRFLSALGRAIQKGGAIKSLERFPEWQS